MEKDKYEAYCQAVELLRQAAHPDQAAMAQDMADLLEADPSLYAEFVAFQVTEVLSALISRGILQPMSGPTDETEH